MPLRSGDIPIEDQIADRMVAVMQADGELNQTEINIAAPVSVHRELEDLTIEDLYLDVYAVGIRQTQLNRRHDQYDYETHIVPRSRPDGDITQAWVRQISWYRDYAQGLFSIENGNQTLTLTPSGLKVTRVESEPFVVYGRQDIENGLYVAPVRIVWRTARR